jgi:tetratricopeptide (TPR) repeat protein
MISTLISSYRLGIAAALVAAGLLAGCASGEIANSTALLVNRDFDSAKAKAQSVLADDPDNEEALALLGWSDFMLDRYDDARRSFRRLLAINEGHFDGLLGMAWTTIKRGEYDVAEDYLGQASQHLRFDWQKRMLPDARGWIALHRGDLDAAEESFHEELRLAVEVWDRQADAFVGLGWVSIKRGDLDRARTMFRRGLDDSDKCFFCRDGLARVAFERGEYDEAVRQAAAAAAIAPAKKDLLASLDSAIEKLGDPGRRISVYETLARKHSSNAFLQERLGRAYRGAGQNALARAAFERALKLNPQLDDARDELEAISNGAETRPASKTDRTSMFIAPRRTGVAAAMAGRRGHLLRANFVQPRGFDASKRLLHRTSIALYNQGWALIDAGRLDEAERAFRAAQAQAPDAVKWTAEDGLGWVAYYRRDYDKAQALFTKVLQARPEAYLSLKGLGFVALERKNYDEAVKYLISSLSQNPYQVSLSYTIPATRLLDAKKFDHARRILELGEWSYPRSAEIHFLFARALIGMNERKRAIEKATLAAGLDPTGINLVFDEFPVTGREIAEAYRTIAWGLYLAGDSAGAFRRFDQYIQSGGDDPDGLRGRGFALYRLGRYEEAVADLQKVTQHEPERLSPISEELPIPGTNQRAQITYNASSTLAWSYFKLNRAAKAEMEFRKVLKTHPFWADALTGLGYSLLAQNDRDGAAQNFREALRIAPGYADARRGLTMAETAAPGGGPQTTTRGG